MKRRAGERGDSLSGGEATPKRARVSEDVSSVGRYDHYRKGSIVRVTLHNFMSYTDAHFEPGPLLNVILGPNGTGKSSIVCAIALGLNGPTTVLGRAKETREFIKLGTDKGFVELELARAMSGGRNLTIRRTLNTDNTSDWRLNNKSATKTEVAKQIAKLNIQVNNVCQFLAQEKVVNFAKLNAQELLIETEKAAAPPHVIEHHLELIDLKKKLNELDNSFALESEHVEDLAAQNAKLERDVLRFREREARLAQVKIMQLKKPMVIYKTHLKRQKELEQEVNAASAELGQYMEKVKPVEEKIEKLTAEKAAMEAAYAKEKEKLQRLDELRKKAMAKGSSMSNNLDKLRSDLAMVTTNEQKRLAKIHALEARLQETTTELAELKDPDELEVVAINTKIEAVQDRLLEAKERQRDHEASTRGLQMELQAAERNLAQMSDLRAQAEHRLKSLDPQAYKARQWINNHKHTLRHEVYGPVTMELNVTEPYHRDCLGQQAARYVQLGFVAQCEEDRDALLREFKRLEIKVSVMGVDMVHAASMQHPDVPPEPFRKYKLKWLDETFTAPEPVMKALYANASLAKVVIGDRSLTPDLAQCAEETGLEQLYTPESKYTSRRSRFGARNRSTMVVPLQPAKNILSLDDSKKKEVEATLRELREKTRDVAAVRHNRKTDIRTLEEEMKDLRMQREQLGSSRRQRGKLEREIKEIKARLKNQKSAKDSAGEEARIKEEMKKYANAQCSLVAKLVEVHQKMVLVATAGDSRHFRQVELQTQLTNLALEKQTILNNAAELERALRDAEARHQEYRDSGAAKKKAAKIAMKKITPEQQEQFKDYPDDLDQLDAQINECQAVADANFRSNPQVIKDYEERRAEIEVLKATLEEKAADRQKKQQEIERIKALWLPPLQDLVGKIHLSFEKYFANIGCEGRVNLCPAENFEDYSLQLMVSFRAGSDAQVLDSSTQSGGERSVTTMLYLLSLQDLTPCPFRLVDEINQGMDPTNERMIFDEVAGSACRTGQPQFFMVTPKLLPGLHFTKDMTVFFIMNGPWNVTQEQWDQVAF